MERELIDWTRDNNVEFKSDMQLFEDGIKANVLVNYKKWIEGFISNQRSNGKYIFSKDLGNKILISWNDLEHIDFDSINDKDIGILLGYYPKSAGTFDRGGNIIDFNGIKFSYGKYEEEALEWCINTYSVNMINKYGYLYYIIYSGGKLKKMGLIK